MKFKLNNILLGIIIAGFIYACVAVIVLALFDSGFDLAKADWKKALGTYFDIMLFIKNPMEIFPNDDAKTAFVVLGTIFSFLVIPSGIGLIFSYARKEKPVILASSERWRRFTSVVLGRCPDCGKKLKFYKKNGKSFRECEDEHIHSSG